MTVQKIDLELCNGCGVCVDSCTMDVLRLDTLAAGAAEYPPCRLACPAGVDMRRYIHLMREGMIDEALAVLKEALPFPAITGRICPHPCEADCARGDVDAAVNINALERFAADNGLMEKVSPARKIYSAKVAVIGSGPAGMSVAYELAGSGYPVMVFESLPVLGGMLRVGVPDYRLPKYVLDRQFDLLKEMGIEFVTGVALGRDLSFPDLKNQGFQAVFLATGAHLSRKLGIPGSELEGVAWGLDFLKETNLRRQPAVKNRVLVIGGGNVAIDAALTALRSGAKQVHLACLESREEMPAYPEEVRQAEDEGVIISTSWGPGKILSNGQSVIGLEMVKCLSVADREGRFNPSYDKSVTSTIETDMLIFAIGQASDLSFLPPEILTTREGGIQVDPVTLETSAPGVFAGGDVTGVQGAAIQAIAAGKRASVSIDRYLKGYDLKAQREGRRRRTSYPPHDRIEPQSRQDTPVMPVELRQHNFLEVKSGFNEDAMVIEARRCMTCGSRAVIRYPEECMACDSCEINCPKNAIYVSPERNAPLMVGWR